MTRRDEVRRLEERLARAWREHEAPAFDAHWRADVMSAVRARAASDARSFEHVLRSGLLVAAAAAVLALAVVGARASSLDPTAEVARLIASDPQGLLQLVLMF